MSTRGSTLTPSNGSTGEGPEVVVNGVFLSPRVVDRRAYGELAGELRDLVRGAAGERSAITSALDQAGRATQELRRQEQAQQGNIELAARALKAMDERAARIERLLAEATEQSRVFEKLEQHAGNLIDEKIGVLEARLGAVTSGATAQAEALEERVRRASRELEQRIENTRRDAQTIAGPASVALTLACERAASLAGTGDGSLGDLIERGERLSEQAGNISRTLEDSTARVEKDRAAIREVEEIGQRVERNLEIVRSRLTQQQTECIARAQGAIDEAQRMAAQVSERAGEARGEGESAVAELRSVIQQSLDAHNTTALAIKVLGRSVEQAKGITERLEPWRGLIEGGSGGLPEPIRAMIETVRGELRGELAGIAGALRGAADRAERSERTLAGVPVVAPVAAAGNPLVAGRVATPAIMPGS